MTTMLLTGGSGDLGRLLIPQIIAQNDHPVNLDLQAPPDNIQGTFIRGSITDRALLMQTLSGVDIVVHIAAWHGIHESRNDKDVYTFWDVNVNGTFEVFEACARSSVKNIIYISSTSIDDRTGIYGHTKVIGEEIANVYAQRHSMNVIILRPRAFIPHWNSYAYKTFVEWAQWFWGGAVHIDDVAQAVMKSIDLLKRGDLPHALTLTVDGAYDYTDKDLARWDADGAGSTFRKYYAAYYELALKYGLDPARRPTKKDISETQKWLGYAPRYSLRHLLQELEQYGEGGPPPPPKG